MPDDTRTPPRVRSPFARLTLPAQVVAVLLYLAVMAALLAAITGLVAFILKTIHEAL